MSQFIDNKDDNQVLIQFMKQQSDDLKYFKLFWSSIKISRSTLPKILFCAEKIDKKPMKSALFHILYRTNKDITSYIMDNHLSLLIEIIFSYFDHYQQEYRFDLDLIPITRTEEDDAFWLKFVKLLFDLCSKIKTTDIINTKLIHVLTNRSGEYYTQRTRYQLKKDYGLKYSLITALLRIHEIAEFFCKTPLITDKNRNKLFGSDSAAFNYLCFHDVHCDYQEYLLDVKLAPLKQKEVEQGKMIWNYFQNDRKITDKMIFNDKLNFHEENTVIDTICERNDIHAHSVLKCLLENDDIINERQWIKLLSKKQNCNITQYYNVFWCLIQMKARDGHIPLKLAALLLKKFANNKSMLDAMIYYNDEFNSIGPRFFKSFITWQEHAYADREYRDSHELINVLLNDTVFSFDDKWSWISDKIRYIFPIEACIIRFDQKYGFDQKYANLYKNIEVILKCFVRDKDKISALLSTDLTKYKDEKILFAGTVLHWICRCIRNDNYLPIILNSTALCYDDKLELFTAKDKQRRYGTILMRWCYAQNVAAVLNYFDLERTKQKQMRALFGGDGKEFMLSLFPMDDKKYRVDLDRSPFMDEYLLEIFKYFDGDNFTMELLLDIGDRFPVLMCYEKTMKYIILESSLTDKEKFRVLKSNDWIDNIFTEKLMAHDLYVPLINTGIWRILEFIRNDASEVWNILSDEEFQKWHAKNSDYIDGNIEQKVGEFLDYFGEVVTKQQRDDFINKIKDAFNV